MCFYLLCTLHLAYSMESQIDSHLYGHLSSHIKMTNANRAIVSSQNQYKTKSINKRTNTNSLTQNTLHYPQMRTDRLQLTYGRQTKYPKQQQEQVDDDYLKKYIRDIREQISKNKGSTNKSHLSKDQLRKSSKSLKRKHRQRQQNSDQQRQHTGYDKFKNKQKYGQSSHKHSSHKQRLKAEQKNINYDQIFNELCLGNSTDVVSAGITYKDILQSITDYIMGKELQMQILTNKNSKSNTKKSSQRHSEEQKPMPTNKKVKQIQNHKKTPATQECIQQQSRKPLKSDKQQNRIIQESQRSDQGQGQWQLEVTFQANFKKFKRISTANNILSVIPYKAIPSLFLIPLLNFLIEKTSSNHIKKYFEQGEKLMKIYQQINTISIQSKRYLVEQKIKKGLRYVTEVEKKINEVYSEKTFRNKLIDVNQIQNQNKTNCLQINLPQFQQSKLQSREQQNLIIQQRKQQTQEKPFILNTNSNASIIPSGNSSINSPETKQKQHALLVEKQKGQKKNQK